MRAAFEQFSDYIAALLIALSGRMLALAVLRPTWSLALLWELPIVIGTAVIGLGVAEWLGYHGKVANAVICGVSYLGPVSITSMVRMLIRRGPS